MATRLSGRGPAELRPIRTQVDFVRTATGSVLIEAGGTMLLCTASIEDSLPPWMKKDTTRGWLTAEYNMLPASTTPRKPRERSKVDGRTTEIQRLIGRSLRAVLNFDALGPRTVTIDCEVLQADGGTRTLGITGGFIALARALKTHPTTRDSVDAILSESVAAVSCGLVDGELLLDLDYSEDHRAEVDFNVVMTGRGEFVELQGTAEGKPFGRKQLDAMLELAEGGLRELATIQQIAIHAS